MSVLINCHVPKTGGTSMANLLRQAYGARHIDLYYPPPCQPLDPKYYPELRRYWGIAQSLSSHQLRYAAPEIFWPGARFVIFLRDPVERLVSLYRHYVRGAPHLKFAAEQPGYLESLAAFVTQIQHQDSQTRFLLGADPEVAMSQNHLILALEELEQYDYIGLTERYEESVKLFALDYPELVDKQAHENRNPDRRREGYRSELTEEILALIEQSNAFDIRLYQRAQDIFAARLKRSAAVNGD